MPKEKEMKFQIKGKEVTISLSEIAAILVKAKLATYAGEDKTTSSERPGFRELEFKEGPWYYRDSYSGFYAAPGQEVLKFDGVPILIMSYSGGMLPKHQGDFDFAMQTFNFLKRALAKVDESRPFRGPKSLTDGDWRYEDSSQGDITNFRGTEQIFYKEKEVFRQYYIGCLVIPK